MGWIAVFHNLEVQCLDGILNVFDLMKLASNDDPKSTREVRDQRTQKAFLQRPESRCSGQP